MKTKTREHKQWLEEKSEGKGKTTGKNITAR